MSIGDHPTSKGVTAECISGKKHASRAIAAKRIFSGSALDGFLENFVDVVVAFGGRRKRKHNLISSIN